MCHLLTLTTVLHTGSWTTEGGTWASQLWTFQERQRAWDGYETEYKQWHAGPHPGKPVHGEPKPEVEYKTHKPLPDFALVIQSLMIIKIA